MRSDTIVVEKADDHLPACAPDPPGCAAPGSSAIVAGSAAGLEGRVGEGGSSTRMNPAEVRFCASARNEGPTASRSQEVTEPVATLVAGRTSWWRGVGYSPTRMVSTEARLTRDAALEKVRARILSAARRDLSPADADDLTQEALLLLTTKYAHVEAPEELVALGVKILRFKRTALWRKRKRRREAGDVSPPAPAEDGTDPLDNVGDGAPDPEARAQDRQRGRLLAEAAAQLPGRCRELLRRKLDGESFVEIAARLGRPVNTVYSWDRRCHQRLKKLLGARWGFVSGKEER